MIQAFAATSLVREPDPLGHRVVDDSQKSGCLYRSCIYNTEGRQLNSRLISKFALILFPVAPASRQRFSGRKPKTNIAPPAPGDILLGYPSARQMRNRRKRGEDLPDIACACATLRRLARLCDSAVRRRVAKQTSRVSVCIAFGRRKPARVRSIEVRQDACFRQEHAFAELF